MFIETLSTLKINKLTQEQYDRELAAGNIDETALYLTHEEEIDLSGYATVEEMNEKADKDHTHEITDVSGLQSALDGKQATITGGASTITGSNLTASRALVSDSSGKVAVSAVTSTELGYLDGVTSSVQTQLDNKSDISHTHDEYMTTTNPTGTGSFSMNRKSGSTVGEYSSTLGKFCTATGKFSSAIGGNAHATGMCAHAEGGSINAFNTNEANSNGTVASGNYAHAEGSSTTASGGASHAEGSSTVASGISSHAEGYYTEALNYQHAQGHYNNTSTATAGNASGTTGTAFVIGCGTSSSTKNAFRVTYDGKIFATSSTITAGADYAEFFEWQDSNSNNEDRRGYFVTLDGNKIKIAEPDEYILGIVSGRPAMIGNGDEEWMGRYILDEFGDFITEEFEYEENIIDKETGETKTITKIGTKYKESPDYDPTIPYTQRDDRPEWDAVGMVGVLSVRDDGTCKVNGFCKVAEGGIATTSESGYRVIKRINENIVKVVFR